MLFLAMYLPEIACSEIGLRLFDTVEYLIHPRDENRICTKIFQNVISIDHLEFKSTRNSYLFHIWYCMFILGHWYPYSPYNYYILFRDCIISLVYCWHRLLLTFGLLKICPIIRYFTPEKHFVNILITVVFSILKEPNHLLTPD